MLALPTVTLLPGRAYLFFLAHCVADCNVVLSNPINIFPLIARGVGDCRRGPFLAAPINDFLVHPVADSNEFFFGRVRHLTMNMVWRISCMEPWYCRHYVVVTGLTSAVSEVVSRMIMKDDRALAQRRGSHDHAPNLKSCPSGCLPHPFLTNTPTLGANLGGRR